LIINKIILYREIFQKMRKLFANYLQMQKIIIYFAKNFNTNYSNK